MKEVLSVRIDKEVLDAITDLQRVRRWVYNIRESKADIITKCLCNGIGSMMPLPEGCQIIRNNGSEPEVIVYDEETRMLMNRLDTFTEFWEDIIYGKDDEEDE